MKKTRIIAAAILAASVALGTTGCDMIQPQATTKHYDASDGISLNVGSLGVRNAIVISDDGELASLLVSVVNGTGSARTLSIQYVGAGVSHTVSVAVPTSDLRGTTWGGHNDPQIILPQIATHPGSMLEINFSDGTATQSTLVPVLTTAQPEYNGLGPVATPTPTASK